MTETLATRTELTDAITLLCHRAKREMAVVGTPLLPTPWDLLHIRINAKLDQLDGQAPTQDA